MKRDVLDDLVAMSATLAEPANEYVILGEGNTSTRADVESFWIKASGTQLAGATRDGFVQVRFKPILAAMAGPDMDDDAVKQLLKSATSSYARSPSIETFLHAICLQLDGVTVVAHTHPIAAGGLLCGQRSRELFSGALFPDQIVVLGPTYVYVPYMDPGLPLARAVSEAINDFIAKEQRVPKVILMENHGVIALGGSTREALNITQMLVKTCKIISGTLIAGGPRYLSPANVDRIDRRPDELARRATIK
jgi:rhamnose utilization protein RhaD (predicted bifunctional aldolase and dehydrogenase)